MCVESLHTTDSYAQEERCPATTVIIEMPVYFLSHTLSQSRQFTIMAGLRIYSFKLFNPLICTNIHTPNIFEQKLYKLGILT